MRQHVGAREQVEEAPGHGLRLKVVDVVVVAVLKNAVPPLQPAEDGQHRLRLCAERVGVGVIVFADGVGFLQHALARHAQNVGE